MTASTACSDPEIRSIGEFERRYLPAKFIYDCRVRFAARAGLGAWLARLTVKAARGARVPKLPASFYADVAREQARLRPRWPHLQARG